MTLKTCCYLRKKSYALQFPLAKQLREELLAFAKRRRLPTDFIDEDSKWNIFVINLVSCLIDQPILNPIQSIAEFRYVATNDTAIIWYIKFNDNRGGMQFLDRS